ncbi:bifunctional glutamate N-acetyltransferase/amino-acid acetyltransferase ArgJ [Apilactobacillus kunkeei]|uniref:bifunctional glutamate N-acetyltransferase/amino-acid acetyltransferase ArgJ n=1 Tax=Apilactobacillus kunkeei TaxID=148814 RepID=UPI00110D2443|nr:bifunctional glutamate N-acetyltransferase/amino-acid acetyltransferase ArgJ [Apilactobacillus kunkeei]TMT01672.1 bifunctional glutamate N-acetyltransferase/amino-acid acetyltransferase ArgJ [Apilactobacillus kunkeei]
MKTINFKWPKNIKSGSTHAGFKEDGKLDMCWIVSNTPAAAAGVYTTNQFKAAPVQVTKKTIDLKHELQAIIVNSGNANSFTGDEGIQNVYDSKKLVADKLHLDESLIGVASTGIIGKQLDMDTYQEGVDNLKLSDEDIDAPEAIITTDTCSKKVCVEVILNDQPVTITGFSKGSGMIHPNMGTTLSCIVTDANIDGDDLQNLLSEDIISTFNQITVDGCMSTNDMVLSMANGSASEDKLVPGTAEYIEFAKSFKYVLETLAKKVAQDGEGANNFVEVNVNSAFDKQEANLVSKAIVGSNLVKSMIFGKEANWGRIVQAIGQTHAHVDPNHVTISLNGTEIVTNSEPVSFTDKELKSMFTDEHIIIDVDLNVGNASGTAWGCDLTYKYVEINAAYEG